jgi:hypothetical protein
METIFPKSYVTSLFIPRVQAQQWVSALWGELQQWHYDSSSSFLKIGP